MTKHYLFFFALIIITKSTAHGQAPNIVPVAPEAAALAKEVNYPVSYNTGVANISVPLTQIQRGNLTLPIALSYHSGGFKTNERSGSVGLGFSLSCDLQITRTINGMDDLHPNKKGYPFNPYMQPYVPGVSAYNYPLCGGSSYESAASHAYAIAAGGEDGMPDKFNYRLLNKSGSFLFTKEGIVTVPYDNTIRVTYHESGNDNGFRVVDSDGTTYYFEYYREQVVPTGTFTSWKCKKIENSTKTESLEFKWADKSPQVTTNRYDKIVYENDLDACSLPGYHTADEIASWVQYYEDSDKYPLSSPKIIEHFGDGRPALYHLPYLDNHRNIIDKTYPSKLNHSYGSTSTTTAMVLSEIAFRGGKVTFHGTDQLQRITITDASGNLVKSIWFSQSYTRPANLAAAKATNGNSFEGTSYLDGITIYGGNSKLIEEYGFQYGEKFCFGSHLVGKDAWGYVNDHTTDLSLPYAGYNGPISIPRQSVTQDVLLSTWGYGAGCNIVNNVTFTFGNSNNTELPSRRALVGLLSRIVYPTGGYVDFQYEPNKYALEHTGGYTLKQGGGARIRSITHYDGKHAAAAHQKYFRYGELEDGTGTMIYPPNNRTDLSSEQYNGYSYTTIHTHIPEYSPSIRTQRTTYEPASSQTYTYPNGASIYYTKVTEYNSDFGVNTGKKVYTYYPHRTFMPGVDLSTRIDGTNVDVLHPDGLMGQQHFVKDYKYENGAYTLVHSKEYKYELRTLTNQVRVVYSYIASTLSGGMPNDQDCQRNAEMQFVNCNFSQSGTRYLMKTCSAFLAGEYGLEIGNVLLTEEIETTIRNGSSLAQKTEYFYDNNSYWQPSRIVTTNSQGQQLQKTFKYCYDFSDGVHTAMRSKNMVSLPVEEILYNNTLNKEVSRVKTNYGNIEISPSQSFIAPVQVQKSFGGAALQTHLTYDLYDEYGNILQVTGKDKLPVTYLWGYNGLYPIAEIKGATYAQVSGTTSATSLETLLSTHDGAQIAAGMNERRALFPSALITSFTHKPMVGIRSITNAAGVPAYFEYDDGGRLQMVKDKNEDIIKAYDYKMQNQTIGLAAQPAYLVNVPHMQTLSYLNYHTVPQTHFSFNYVAEGGKYTGYMNYHTDLDVAREIENALPPYNLDIPEHAKASEKISLYSRHIYSAYLDLFKDGSVVYSKPFRSTFVRPEDPYTPVEFYIAPGRYQASLRLEGNNYTGLIKFTLYDGTSNISLRPGDSVDIQAGKAYSFTIYVEGQ